MIERHLMRLRARDDISAAEEAAIRDAVAGHREVKANEVLVHAHETVDVCLLLLSGLVARRKTLPDGRRQITELHVAGDFTDLHSFSLKRLDHDVIAMTRSAIAMVPHAKIREITEAFPHLTRVYWFLTNLDAAIHREWELSLGQRNALERMAHLFCELQTRLALVGLADGDRFELPLTQPELGECLGISTVHVNRTLMQLRSQEIADLARGRLVIHDLERMQALCDFDPAYLYLEKRPR